MKRRTLTAALLLGGLSAGSCLVYDKDDLPAGEAVGGSSGLGGAGMGGGGASGGTSGGGTTGGSLGGGATSGGSLGGGSDAGGEGGSGASDAGEGGEGGDGQAGASPSGGSGGTGAVSGSSGAGTGGTLGGGSGVGGAPAAGGTITWAPELIDNCEDLDSRLLPHEMRSGYWYTLSDKTPRATLSPVATAQWMTELPVAEQTAENRAALQVQMAGFNRVPPGGWGAGAGLDFRAPLAVYDASNFAGISFVAKASAAVLPFQVKISLKGTVAFGNVCMEAATTPSAQLCGNHPVKHVMLSTSWARYDLKWSDFMQDTSWGKQVPFAPAELVSLQFIVPPPDSNDAFFWIDDVKFLVTTSAASEPAEAP